MSFTCHNYGGTLIRLIRSAGVSLVVHNSAFQKFSNQAFIITFVYGPISLMAPNLTAWDCGAIDGVSEKTRQILNFLRICVSECNTYTEFNSLHNANTQCRYIEYVTRFKYKLAAIHSVHGSSGLRQQQFDHCLHLPLSANLVIYRRLILQGGANTLLARYYTKLISQNQFIFTAVYVIYLSVQIAYITDQRHMLDCLNK